MKGLQINVQQKKELSVRSRKIAYKNFSNENISKTYINVYEEYR